MEPDRPRRRAGGHLQEELSTATADYQSFLRREIDGWRRAATVSIGRVSAASPRALDTQALQLVAAWLEALQRGIAQRVEQQQAAASAVATGDSVAEQAAAVPLPDYEELTARALVAQLAELDDFYFLQGQRRLRGLREWAAGRATLERPE